MVTDTRFSTATDTRLSPEVVQMLAIGGLPDVHWRDHDDQCDCTFQRVAQWTNSIMGVTHEERLCCIWARLHEMFPGASRDIPAWFDINAQEWNTEPQEWDGETEMPKAVWYRQLARKENRSLADIRAEYADKDYLRPQGKVRSPKPSFLLPYCGEYVAVELGR